MNAPPVAAAGADQSANQGATVTFDGTSSSDPDGVLSIYQWDITSAPAGSTAFLVDSATDTASITADIGGEYVIELQVEDADGVTSTDTVTLTVNGAPVANAGAEVMSHW